MSKLLVCNSNDQELTPNVRRAPIMGNGSENLLGDSRSESEAIAQGAPAERDLIHRLSAANRRRLIVFRTARILRAHTRM